MPSFLHIGIILTFFLVKLVSPVVYKAVSEIFLAITVKGEKMNTDKDSIEKLVIGLMIAVIFIVGFNTFEIGSMNNMKILQNDMPASQSGQDSVQSMQGIDVLPKGVPRIYGAELGVSYDDISSADQKKADATIKKLGLLDEQIKLSGKDKERYIAIAGQISCEYCCGVESIIFKDGSAACSCQHSFAMRGVAKYLIKNHPNEFTNDEILEELGKWKTLFFPQQIGKKALLLQEKGIEINYINLASNKYRNIEG